MASEPLVLAESKQISNQSSPAGAFIALMSILSEAQITSSQLNLLLVSGTRSLHRVTRTTANAPMTAVGARSSCCPSCTGLVRSLNPKINTCSLRIQLVTRGCEIWPLSACERPAAARRCHTSAAQRCSPAPVWNWLPTEYSDSVLFTLLEMKPHPSSIA